MPDSAIAIQNLCDAYGQKLNDLHDDYAHTRMLWTSLQVRVQRYNENPSVQNPVTGSVVEGVALAAKAPSSLERLRKRSFKDIVAQFELFTAELLRIWLFAHPMLMAEKALNVATILGSLTLADAQAAAVAEAVESTIAKRMYGKPETWFEYLRKNLRVRFNAPTELSFAEMKARRDVLEHNNGIVEVAYRDKSKAAAKYNVGDRVLLADDDVDAAYQLVRELVLKSAADAIVTSKVH